MKLILEKMDGAVYAYIESDKHHRAVKKNKARTTPRLDQDVLADDCNVSNRDDFHIVFNLKKRKK